MTERVFRYVLWRDAPRRLAQGWCFAADLGPTHGTYSVLMEWICSCGRASR